MTFPFFVGGLRNITKAEKQKYRQEIPCRTKSITGGLEDEDQHEGHKWSVAGGTAGMHQLVLRLEAHCWQIPLSKYL